MLRLVEAMHLVDEDDRGAAAVLLHLRLLNGIADVLHAGEHGREHDEMRIDRARHDARQRRLAHARRAPQDHRVQAPRFERRAQCAPRAEQMLLADHLIERAWAQPLGQRCAARRTIARAALRVAIEQRLLRSHRFILAARGRPHHSPSARTSQTLARKPGPCNAGPNAKRPPSKVT